MSAFITDNLTPIVVVLAAGLAGTLGGLVVTVRRLAGVRARLDALTRGEDGRSLQAILESHLAQVVDAIGETRELAQRTTSLEASGRKAFQRIGLVRFNPFEDTGGNQSFALALLDADDDGIIMSSLHARGGTRIYTKSVAGGRAEASLSEEEEAALSLARGSSAGRVALNDRTRTDRSAAAAARR